MLVKKTTSMKADALNSFTGKVEKAIIELHDGRKVFEKAEGVQDWDVVKVEKKKQNEKTTITGVSAFGGPLETSLSVDQLAAATMSGNAITANSGNNGVGKDDYKRLFEVKFNPASISISASGGGSYHKEDSGNADDLGFTSMDETYYLSVKLIFDTYEFSDSFMNLTTRMSLGDIAYKTMKEKNQKLAKTDGHLLTVKDQVEAFSYALRNPYTRYCAFNWGQMRYEGILNQFSAQYTMFDMDGNPVRAMASMKIELVDYTLNGKNLGYWDESYNIAFRQLATGFTANGLDVETSNLSQLFPNLFNI